MSERQRIAVVTGASRGLGEVIARVLAVRGFDLVIGGRDRAGLVESAAALRALGRRVVPVDGNIADAGVRAWMIDEARQLGGLNVLVNNASELGGIRPMTELDAPRVEHVFLVNVIAPIALAGLGAPLLQQHGGLIVNVTSDAAYGAYPGWGAYGASKAALELVSRTQNAELRERRVFAVTVDPGDLRTRLHQEAFPDEDISDRPKPEVTVPFWNWLFAQDPSTVGGERFRAQEANQRWLQQV